MKKVLITIIILFGTKVFAAPTNSGMYATLQTTMGDICFELYHARVPRTVANFVSLAEGTRPWIDPRNGFISREPYYNDIIFHRVIDNFMIQCGSPKGTGSDGPGYTFQDEFDPSLRHDHPGIVSMANSGPNRNGGQFFITVKNTQWLDDKHTVFGSVVEGMNIVSNISAVAVEENAKPLDDIVITNVFITRNGASAQVFDPSEVVPALPVVRSAVSRIYESSGEWFLDWEEHSGGEYWLFATRDLKSAIWGDLMGYSVGWSNAIITGIVNKYPKVFFNVTETISTE